MSAPRLAPGQLIADKYSIRAMLGYGGAAATYAAVLPPGREVVVKVFSLQLAQRGDVLGVLQQVAALTNGLADSTAPILESGFDTQIGVPFMVTDRVLLPSLAEAMQNGVFAPADVVLLLRGIARPVDVAHTWRLAHGALKPQNVFVGAAPGLAVRVVDFGVAVARAAMRTNEGFALSAPWMAPEQMQGIPGGPLADVFSAALVAFFAATGRSYWRSCQGLTPDLAAWQHEIVGPRVPPSVRATELGASLAPAFDGPLLRALALHPAERFASLGELTDALAGVLTASQQNMALGMSSLGPRSQSVMVLPRSRTGLLVALALVALLLVVAAVGAFLVLRRGPASAVDPPAGPDTVQSVVASAPAPAASMSTVAVPPTVETLVTAPLAGVVLDASALAGDGSGGGPAVVAELVVVCTPDCDSVAIDDRTLESSDAGVVPRDPVQVAVGAHIVTVRRTTYVSQTRRVTLTPGQKARETFYLSRPGAVPPLPRPCGKFLERCPG